MKKSYIVKYKSFLEKDVLEERIKTQRYFNGARIGSEREEVTYLYPNKVCEIMIRAIDEAGAYCIALDNRCRIGISEIISVNEIRTLERG